MIPIATMYWPHLFLLTHITLISTWVSLSLLSLVIPVVLSSFWHSASSLQQCLVFCPAGHTNFGVCQWEPASVVWHVGSYSHTPAPFEGRGLLDSEEPQPSLLAQEEKAPLRLFSETQTRMEMTGNLGLEVSHFLYLENLHCWLLAGTLWLVIKGIFA